MNQLDFTPHHVNANFEDFVGNNGIGRYIFLPGSDGRAQDIAKHFDQLIVKSHPRGHHLYLGQLSCGHNTIDVAAISSGMGCPSMEIILHELFHLGGKRFLRVGTAGSLQTKIVKLGDIVNAHASVRDENTTIDYVPLSLPAIASFEFTTPILSAAKKLHLSEKLHSGLVHCKSSFYARQFGAGPKSGENKEYINVLIESGVLATEMETASLFIQSQLYHHQLKKQGRGPQYGVLVGALLGILSVPPHDFASEEQTKTIIKHLIELALETIKTLALSEKSLDQ